MPSQGKRISLASTILQRGACLKGEAWLVDRIGKSPQQLWDACPSGCWMLWTLRRFGTPATIAKFEPLDAALRKSGYPFYSDCATGMLERGDRELADALRAISPTVPELSS